MKQLPSILLLLILGSQFVLPADSRAALPLVNEGKIALVQYDGDAHFADPATNIQNLTSLARKAIANGAKIIVFPEGSTYGYSTPKAYWCAPNPVEIARKNKAKSPPDFAKCRDVRLAAENIPSGPSSLYWSKISKSEGVYILFSVPEKGEDGKFYNSVGIAHPSGEVTKYRKRVLYITDQYYASRGAGPHILDTPYGKFGILICKDLTFPRGYAGEDPMDTGMIEEARDLGLTAVIAAMDWEGSPPKSDRKFVGLRWFQKRATETGVAIYAADNPKWDSSGFYEPGKNRVRIGGLPQYAEGAEGITYHDLPAQKTAPQN